MNGKQKGNEQPTNIHESMRNSWMPCARAHKAHKLMIVFSCDHSRVLNTHLCTNYHSRTMLATYVAAFFLLLKFGLTWLVSAHGLIYILFAKWWWINSPNWTTHYYTQKFLVGVSARNKIIHFFSRSFQPQFDVNWMKSKRRCTQTHKTAYNGIVKEKTLLITVEQKIIIGFYFLFFGSNRCFYSADWAV